MVLSPPPRLPLCGCLCSFAASASALPFPPFPLRSPVGPLPLASAFVITLVFTAAYTPSALPLPILHRLRCVPVDSAQPLPSPPPFPPLTAQQSAASMHRCRSGEMCVLAGVRSARRVQCRCCRSLCLCLCGVSLVCVAADPLVMLVLATASPQHQPSRQHGSTSHSGHPAASIRSCDCCRASVVNLGFCVCVAPGCGDETVMRYRDLHASRVIGTVNAAHAH